MIKHKLSDEQLEYQKLARDFAQREIATASAGFDKSGDFPGDLIKKLWEIGLLNSSIAEKQGGLGLGALDSCIIAEELAAACSGIAGSVEASNLAQLFLIECGSDDQKNEYLAPLMEGPSLAGYAMAGGLKAARVFYRKDGDSYVLSGKHGAFINGGLAEWYVVAASEDRRDIENQRKAGVSRNSQTYFIVRGDEDGLDFGERLATLGRRSLTIASARMDEICLPASAMLGESGQAEQIYRQVMGRGYVQLAAGMVGVGRSALEHAVRYSKERKTFGVPIAQHQAVAFMIADMAKDIEAARLLVYQAAQLADQNIACAAEAVTAKAFAQEMVMRVATDAVQVFGGYGFSREYPVEKLMRDAKVYQLMEHTAEEHKVEIGRQLVMSL
jgi:acyl-CoA dehydrogenase